jgi:hypothetical protein
LALALWYLFPSLDPNFMVHFSQGWLPWISKISLRTGSIHHIKCYLLTMNVLLSPSSEETLRYNLKVHGRYATSIAWINSWLIKLIIIQKD